MINYTRPYRLHFQIDNTKTWLDFSTKAEAQQWAKKANVLGEIENTITKEITKVTY